MSGLREPASAIAASVPVVIIVGGDALALSAAREICEMQGHRVVVLWPADAEFEVEVEGIGAILVAGRPETREALEAAGVMRAVSILALSRDDQVNLQVALRARDINPRIRIVLRQFNRTLAAKIEQNLPNCSVLSLAWHSAATYAAVALDPTCLRGLQFPDLNGPLTGFAARDADQAGVVGQTVADAEAMLAARVVAIDGDIGIAVDTVVPSGAQLIVYATIEQLLVSAPRQSVAENRPRLGDRLHDGLHRGHIRLRRIDRYIYGFAAVAAALFWVSTWHFRVAFGIDWLTAAYFVMSTMTTTGYGDITPDRGNPLDVVMAMVLMLFGTVATGIFIAFAAARLTRGQWVRMQGLRPVRRRGHIVVCGCGSIGTGVIDLLLQFDKPIVVVESRPDAALVERARDLGFDLLTGDASRDDALDLCNLDAAHSLVALTNVDTLNLEVALGARARNPSMPIVLRIAEAGFAASIARHFQFETTFSVAALAGPVFAGLSRLDGARGRVAFNGQEFAIAEAVMRDNGLELPRDAIVLAAAKGSEVALIRDLHDLAGGTEVLILVPLAPFHDGRENFAAIADRAQTS
ncbi:MAG TPA: NAD-binding protein [Stellaceae bacterium]|jgi:voltage-gated potassium channel Kch|nr:NAD-binding protein [Stellaceae bacterium]